MNCAESQDLLLDLAYGELPPARAAEVQEHVLGCASCRAEKEQLDDARRAAAPLRDLEEPPAGFDEPILRAARAEAGMQADGTPGPVVEVAASVKPLGLQAARLDPHARMRGGAERPRPRWWRRAAVVGSIAAAAGLAVVVTSSITTRAPPAPREEVEPIQVRAPGAPVPTALDHALSAGDERTALAEKKYAPSGEPVPAQPPARHAAKKDTNAQPAKARPERRDAEGPAAREEDRLVPTSSAEHLLKELPPHKAPANDSLALRSRASAPAAAKAPAASPPAKTDAAPPPEIEKAPPAMKVEEAPPRPRAKGVVGTPASSAGQQGREAAVSDELPPPGAVSGTLSGRRFAEEVPADPEQLEDRASAARRRGEYARAASLYRDASALRRQSDPARAAWDMAHAVECLAAGGQVDEAVAVRKELLRTFPDHTGPKAAADSALRSMRLPPDEDRPPAPVK